MLANEAAFDFVMPVCFMRCSHWFYPKELSWTTLAMSVPATAELYKVITFLMWRANLISIGIGIG